MSVGRCFKMIGFSPSVPGDFLLWNPWKASLTFSGVTQSGWKAFIWICIGCIGLATFCWGCFLPLEKFLALATYGSLASQEEIKTAYVIASEARAFTSFYI